MAVWKRQRENICTLEASPAATDWTLPLDLLLEIVARSDISTLLASTLACKLIRREILSPAFIRHLIQRGIVPPYILATVNGMDDPPPPLSLVHPATPGASSLLNGHISPLVSRFTDELLDEYYYPLTSSGGLILFKLCHFIDRLTSEFCAYDPFSGHRTFFSDPPPPDVNPVHDNMFPRYALLTAADGLDCFFLIFILHPVTPPGYNYASIMEVHTPTSMSNTWEPAITRHNRLLSQQDYRGMQKKYYRPPERCHLLATVQVS
jgi:hypothetical protein